MHNTQLIKIIRSFSQEEANLFTDFIYSPFFNKSKTVQKLWDVLKKYAPECEHPALEREKIFEVVFKGKEYNYGTMKNLIHSMTTLAEKFLESCFHEQDKFQHDYNSLVYSIVKYYPDTFNKKFGKSIKDFGDIKEGMDYHYLYKYMLMRLGSSFSSLESRRDKILFEQGESLIYFFLIHIFQTYHNIKVFSMSENYTEKNNLVEEVLKNINIEKILEKIKKDDPKNFQIVNLYYYLHRLRMEPDNDNYFLPFKEMLINTRETIHTFEFEAISTAFFSILSQRSYMGTKGTEKEFSSYYRYLMDTGSNISSTESKISTIVFINVVKQFSEAGDVEYIENFYNESKKKILAKDMENMENFYNAYLCYAKNDFNKSLEYASKTKPEVNKFKLFVKDLQIRCYYQLGEADAFAYTLKAYRQLLYRADFITEKVQEYHKNFLNSINSLFDFKYFQKGILHEISFDIEKNKMINKEWMLEIMDEVTKSDRTFVPKTETLT